MAVLITQIGIRLASEIKTRFNTQKRDSKNLFLGIKPQGKEKLMPLTPHETAQLLIRGIEQRIVAQGEFSRFQLSLKGIAILADRQFIDQYFANAFSSELINFGWLMFQIDNSAYGFMSLESARGLRKMGGETLISFAKKEKI